MSIYRMVEVRMWQDPWFRSLTDSGRVLWIYLLTSNRSLSIPGVLIARQMVVSDDLNWPLEKTTETLSKEFGPLLGKEQYLRFERFSHDTDSGLWVLPNALKPGKARPHSRRMNPNITKNWAHVWRNQVPQSELKNELYHLLEAFLDQFGKEYTDLFRKNAGSLSEQVIGNRYIGRTPSNAYRPLKGSGETLQDSQPDKPVAVADKSATRAAAGNRAAKTREHNAAVREATAEIVEFFNQAFNRSLAPEGWRDSVRRVLDAGYSVTAMRGVIWWAANAWSANLHAAITPKTLLKLQSPQGKGTFPEYLAQAGEAFRAQNPGQPVPWDPQ